MKSFAWGATNGVLTIPVIYALGISPIWKGMLLGMAAMFINDMVGIVVKAWGR